MQLKMQLLPELPDQLGALRQGGGYPHPGLNFYGTGETGRPQHQPCLSHPYIPQIVTALKKAQSLGMKLPAVYNANAFEEAGALDH